MNWRKSRLLSLISSKSMKLSSSCMTLNVLPKKMIKEIRAPLLSKKWRSSLKTLRKASTMPKKTGKRKKLS